MTLGWILEGDRERFLAARDPTPAPRNLRPSFQCPFCADSFGHRGQLDSHVQQRHVVSRPFVLIGGSEPGAEDVIRIGRVLPSVETFNCTELRAGFDGGPIEPIGAEQLAERLATVRRATLRLRLTNRGDGGTQPVFQDYRIRVLAPDESSLTKVDKLFLATLGVDEVDLEKVGLFYEMTRDGVAAEYAEALADYVRGVLLKDGDQRTGVSTRLRHYHDIHNRALTVLASFERPLAKLLCVIMRFGLNDFSKWREPSGFAHLDHAYAALAPLAQESVTGIENRPMNAQRQSAQVFLCPVDVGTDLVARLATQATQLARWGSTAEQQFIALAEQPNIDSLDRAKIRALWAATALRVGADMSAQRALRVLDGDPIFGPWANKRLIEVNT